jgi:hypothetical protein
MIASDLARELGNTRNAFGIIEGIAIAMQEALEREVGGDFMSESKLRLDHALEEARTALNLCYEAVDDLPRTVQEI